MMSWMIDSTHSKQGIQIIVNPCKSQVADLLSHLGKIYPYHVWWACKWGRYWMVGWTGATNCWIFKTSGWLKQASTLRNILPYLTCKKMLGKHGKTSKTLILSYILIPETGHLILVPATRKSGRIDSAAINSWSKKGSKRGTHNGPTVDWAFSVLDFRQSKFERHFDGF